MRKTLGLIAVFMLILVALVAAVSAMKTNDPIVFRATTGDGFDLYISNTSDTTLVINHITVITSRGVITSEQSVRVTNGSLNVKAPIEWRAGEEAIVMVGCTYGRVNFVRQVTKFL